MIKSITIIFILLSFYSFSGYSQQSNSDSLQNQSMVTLTAVLEKNEIPLNRTGNCIIRISWEGDLDLIELGEIEEPILSNLEIIGSSASNRVMGIPGGKRSIKEIIYILQPVSLGMGYVEPVGLSYTEITSGKKHFLRTQRIGVEVLSPVPEKGEFRISWIWIAATGGIIGICILIVFIRQKKKRLHEPTIIHSILEETYLEQLKDAVDLKSKERRESFSILSKLYRTYLSEKYAISALEATTEELLKILKEAGLDESLVRKSEILFSKSDVVKFSGQDATQAELDEAYTTVETILESHLVRIREKMAKMEERNSKKKGRKIKTAQGNNDSK